MLIYDSLIIGSGPAGLTASIYAVRSALKTAVFSGIQMGGQLTITTIVENFPGFPNGVGGTKLMLDTMDQAKNLGVEIINESVASIKKSGDIFEIISNTSQVYTTKSVIVATGASARWLNIGEKELIGRGVSGCATCDGMFFKDKTVAMVGGGNAACGEAAFLSKIAAKVFMIHRRDSFRAVASEQKHVLNNPKIEILWNTEVKRVRGDQKLESIVIFNNQTNQESELKVDGMFVAIGRDPATEFVKDFLELTESNNIVVGKDQNFPTMTSVSGVFAAGDCVDAKYMQAIVAAGDGARAALDMAKWLER